MFRSRIALLTVAGLTVLALAVRAADKSTPEDPFTGKNTDGWAIKGKDPAKSKWKVGTASVNDKGELVFKEGEGELVNTGSGGVDIFTLERYGDILLDVEVMVPKGSNSGIYLMGEYELQVFDSFGKEKLGQGDMGAIYSAAAPRVNASKKAGEWQKFVIDFQAPRFEGGKKTTNAKFLKVTLNDQVIHENVEVQKSTGGALANKEEPTGPLMFQGDHGTVAYRNIKIKRK